MKNFILVILVPIITTLLLRLAIYIVMGIFILIYDITRKTFLGEITHDIANFLDFDMFKFGDCWFFWLLAAIASLFTTIVSLSEYGD